MSVVILGGGDVNRRPRRYIDKAAVLEALRMCDLDADEILQAVIQSRGQYRGCCIFEALYDQKINITSQ